MEKEIMAIANRIKELEARLKNNVSKNSIDALDLKLQKNNLLIIKRMSWIG